MTDDTSTTPPLVPGSAKEKIATAVFNIANLPPQAPLERGWQMFVSVVLGILIGLVGCGILYVWARVYIATSGTASSWLIFVVGALTVYAGGNHASKQLTRGSFARSLSGLVSPIRGIAAAVRGTKDEEPSE